MTSVDYALLLQTRSNMRPGVEILESSKYTFVDFHGSLTNLRD